MPPYGFLLGLPGQPPLLEAEVAPADLRELRLAWRGKVEGVALAMLALTLLGLAVLSRERQERSTTRRELSAIYVGGILLLLIGARLLLAMAVPEALAAQGVGAAGRTPADSIARRFRRDGTAASRARRARRATSSSAGD